KKDSIIDVNGCTASTCISLCFTIDFKRDKYSGSNSRNVFKNTSTPFTSLNEISSSACSVPIGNKQADDIPHSIKQPRFSLQLVLVLHKVHFFAIEKSGQYARFFQNLFCFFLLYRLFAARFPLDPQRSCDTNRTINAGNHTNHQGERKCED